MQRKIAILALLTALLLTGCRGNDKTTAPQETARATEEPGELPVMTVPVQTAPPEATETAGKTGGYSYGPLTTVPLPPPAHGGWESAPEAAPEGTAPPETTEPPETTSAETQPAAAPVSTGIELPFVPAR